jgi:hypothetical protein
LDATRAVQVVPPSVVVMAASTGPPIFPMAVATHLVTEGQAMPKSPPTSLGVGCELQVVPPSVVPTAAPLLETEKLVSPTASQLVTEGQATLVSSWIPPGTLWAFQVTPPLLVPMAIPRLGATEAPALPTASQTTAEEQATPLS